MKKYDYALFDLDGTILDTREGVISAAIFAMKQYGKDLPDQKALEELIGPPIQVSFQKLYGISDSEAMEMANIFRDAYKTDDFLFKAIPYDGIYDLFSSLIDAGIMIGIATYKREDYAKRLLNEKGFGKYTDYMYGSDLEGKQKKQDIIKRCLDRMGCEDYSRSVYVGDGKSDGSGANSVGMNFVAVTYGFGFKTATDAKEFYPVGIANSCKEIKDIIINQSLKHKRERGGRVNCEKR